MAQENAANGNGRLTEERQEEEWFPAPQPNPPLVELIRLVQETIEARKRTEEEEREKRREALLPRKEAPQREEVPQRSSPRRVRYNLD